MLGRPKNVKAEVFASLFFVEAIARGHIPTMIPIMQTLLQ
jgi:hypothetical protein